MSENDNSTQEKENTSTDSSVTDTTTKTGTSASSEFIDDPVEKKETFTFTSDEQVMSDKQYLDSSIDEILSLISSNSLMTTHSVEENFTSTTRTPSDEPRIVSNILDAIALALEKLEAEMKAVKNVGTAIQNTDFSDANLASNLGFELLSKQYAPVSTVGSGSNAPKYDGDKTLTEETNKYKQQKEQQSSGGTQPGNTSGGGYPSDGGNEGGTGGDGGNNGGITPTQNTPVETNTPQQNQPVSNTPVETNTPQPEPNQPGQPQEEQGSHTTIINNYYYNNRGGGGGGGRYTEPAPAPAETPVEEPVIEEPVVEPEPIVEPEPEPVIEEPPIEEVVEEEEEFVEPIVQNIPVQQEPAKSSNTLRKIGVATLLGAGVGAAAYGAHEIMKHKEEKDDYYSNDDEDYATYGYDNDSGEE